MLNKNKAEADNVVKSVRGYYDLDRMAGRTKNGIYQNHPDPSEERFCLPNYNSQMTPKNTKLLIFENMRGRYEKSSRKPEETVPIYEPKYDLIMRRAPTAPKFRLYSGRTETKRPQYCNNEYDVKKENLEILSPKKPIPNFEHMYGRQTLRLSNQL